MINLLFRQDDGPEEIGKEENGDPKAKPDKE